MLQRPIVLFNLFDIQNRYFDDAGSGIPEWDIATLDTNGDNIQSVSANHNPNTIVESTQSLRQNVLASAVNNKAVAVQRFDCTDLAKVLSFHGAYLAVAAMVKHTDNNSALNSRVFCKMFSGGTIVVDSGTELVPEIEERTIFGTEDWRLEVHKVKMDSAAVWAEIRLQYLLADTANYDAASFTYWDRPFMGGIVDFQNRGFQGVGIDPNFGYNVNEGDGEVEMVRVSRPSSKLDITVSKVLEGSDLDRDIKAMLDSHSLPTPTPCAIWNNRTKFTNHERHFETAVLDPSSPKYKVPPGVTMRNYKFKFDLPSEV